MSSVRPGFLLPTQTPIMDGRSAPPDIAYTKDYNIYSTNTCGSCGTQVYCTTSVFIDKEIL